MKKLETSQQKDNSGGKKEQPTEEKKPTAKKRSWLLPVLILLIIAGLAGAGIYFGRIQLLAYHQNLQTELADLKEQVQKRVTRSQMDNSLQPLQQSSSRITGRLSKLEQGQKNLLTSTEKLYQLYGRDENAWRLSEVEYLMSIAQHKLVLEHDFAGAAKTLDAASALIAELADPGLLPVRVQISDEIAKLKTRARPDLVGMTLLLSRLGQQISFLTPGYQSKEVLSADSKVEQAPISDPNLPLDKKVKNFISSLVTIKTSKPETEKREQTAIVDVTEKLEDNLKLTRWTVLERDSTQYQRLMQQNIALFKEYYDLENAANADFYDALLKLGKSSLKPELPDISGSLRLLREIIKKREDSVQQEAVNG